jgi:hypothetical protein
MRLQGLLDYYRRSRQTTDLLEALCHAQLRREYQNIIASSRYDDPRCLTRFGFKAYSQGDEDGIIEEIFKRIGTTTKQFIEFGVGNGLENNSHYLLHKGWHGTWIEGDPEKVAAIRRKFEPVITGGQLRVEQLFITRDNINGKIEEVAGGEGVDLLSVDIDGNDYEVLKSITCISPRVVIVEYNAKYRPPVEWVMKYDSSHSWDGTDNFGASLKSFELLLASRGYSLVGCSTTGVNAFFVRNDLVNEELFLAPFDSETHYEPYRHMFNRAFVSGFPASEHPIHVSK